MKFIDSHSTLSKYYLSLKLKVDTGIYLFLKRIAIECLTTLKTIPTSSNDRN